MSRWWILLFNPCLSLSAQNQPAKLLALLLKPRRISKHLIRTKAIYTTANGNPCDVEPASKVVFGVPEKYRPRLLEAYGPTQHRETSAKALMYSHISRHCSSRRWLDHEGTTEIDGETYFVSEPYFRVGDDFSELERFLNKMDCELISDPKSYWYPGHTIRLIFKPK